ncbi:hypothetical protein Cme02nite_31220 [Catellatospora methionotrophica]|uniref:Uncharacterized protein n=1 Tax=Catellatospora methionotrophica TaxID=121620 RepID=A0A8J3LL94_9ACTN|nr:hypothetical protein [Catellatospora methionotrophica]GIG14790.1 hypothetical protein Cme02nite_31220 [Catellatospora methionotrophica]
MVNSEETGRSGPTPPRVLAVDLATALSELCDTDPDRAGAAYSSLWPSVFANGRLTPHTAWAVGELVAVLGDPALGAGDATIRNGVLFLLREIARVTADVDAVRVSKGGPLADCFALLPEVFASVWPIPPGWPSWTRTMAASTAAMLVRHPRLVTRRADVIAYHQETALATADRRECASLVFGLGELGVAPRNWLDDPRLAVRTCAALAPALSDDPDATEVLARAAERPRAFDHSFTEPFVPAAHRMMYLPQLREPPHRALIRTVCERTGDFGRLVHGALSAVGLRGAVRPVAEFGPYLRHAFPAGLPVGDVVSTEQERFARALTDRDELWDGTCAGVGEMFAAAGLPHDREQWCEVRVPVALDGAGRPTYDGVRIFLTLPTWSVRASPQLFLSADRTDPDLLRKLLDVVSAGEVAVEFEGPLQFSAAATGVEAGQLDVGELVARGPYNCQPHYGVGVAAALSLWVSAYQWRDGIAYRQQFVDGVPAGPVETLGPADRADGYRFVFELDPEWVPPGIRLPG